MGQWVRDLNTGVYSLVGGGTRTVAVFDDLMPANAVLTAQVKDPDHDFKLFINGSQDGRSCWEAGVEGANIIIRKVTWGTPAAASASAAWAGTLTTAQPFTMIVRLTERLLEVFLNGDSAAFVSFSIDTDYERFAFFGLAGDDDGTKVLRFEICELSAIIESQKEILYAISAGELWATDEDATLISRIDRRVTVESGVVDSAVLQGKAYLIDGSSAKVFDPIERTVEAYVPTGGSLPGQTEDGTTTATVICSHLDRLYFAGAKDEEEKVRACALGDPLNLDYADDRAGAAFELVPSIDGVVGVGAPVRDLFSGPDEALLIGCAGRMVEWRGDPTISARMRIIDRSDGVCDRDCIAQVSEGRMVALSPDGLQLIPSGGYAENISEFQLKGSLELGGNAGEFRTIVIRDPRRRTVHIFRTPNTASPGTRNVHWAYDEAVGGFSPASGGYLPDDMADELGPTAATVWRGELVIGTRDGRLLSPDDDQESPTDAGTAFAAWTTLSLLTVVEDINLDLLLQRVTFQMAKDGVAPTYTVWAAPSPEEVFTEGSDRWIGATGLVSRAWHTIIRPVRAHAITVELSSEAGWWALERVDALATPVRHVMALARKPIPTPSGMCSPPSGGGGGGGTGTGTGDETFGTGGGSGDDEPGDTGTGTGDDGGGTSTGNQHEPPGSTGGGGIGVE